MANRLWRLLRSQNQIEYDAVLMDVQMPVMNGYEASRRIHTSRRPFGKTIPIIALTANAFAEDIVRSSEAGMDAHITKPIDENKLKECMLRLLASRSDALEKYNVSRETYEEVRRNAGFFFREKCEVNRNDCGYE